MNPQEIGNRIARERRRLGLSRLQLAEMLDISQRSMQDYERGIRVPFAYFPKLEAIFDRPIGWILYGPGPGATYADLAAFDPDLAAQRHDQLVARLNDLAEAVRILTVRVDQLADSRLPR